MDFHLPSASAQLWADSLIVSPKKPKFELMIKNSILKHAFPPDLTKIYDEEFANQLEGTQASVDDAFRMGVMDQTAEEKTENVH